MTFLPVIFILLTAGAIFRRMEVKTRRPAAFCGISFFEEDDSDIKIAGAEPVKKADEALNDAGELEAQRKNGNLDKARLLGGELCDKIISEDGECSFGRDNSEDEITRTQRRLLLAFAMASSVRNHIKSRVLQGVILNVFYNRLKGAQPGFYADITGSGSISFYTLCARRGGDVESCVGQTFAMLVGKEGDDVIAELGKALYLRFVDVAEKSIKSKDIKQ